MVPAEIADSRAQRPTVTIICPVFNEEDCVPLFFERLKTTLSPLWHKYCFELCFTNNGSSDCTLQLIREIREKEPWVQVITLSRNFGYQASLVSGLCNAVGDAVICIDADCEDPPEMIPLFLEGWENGNDIVYGERVNRPESALMKAGRRAFYRITRRIADNDFVLDMAEFSLISRRVRDVCLVQKSTFPFLRNEIGYAGFKRKALPYTRQARVSGRTHYNLLRMTQFAVAGILSSSTFPLRFTLYTGVPLAIINIAAAVISLFRAAPADLQWLIFLNLALLLLGVGLLAVYIARIYKDGLNRPLFIVDENQSWLNHPIVRKVHSVD
jgi:polyisoprenyl-phosphate glycosyltransferase